jgi:hypothetical protein
MNLDAARRIMMPTDRAASIVRRWTLPSGEKAWALLDGAAIPRLRQKLAEEQPQHVCLFGDELPLDRAATSPYLVLLDAPSPMATYALGEGWGRHWGIVAFSKAPMETLVKHFRSLLTVSLPSSETVTFRYYDPRVLSTFLPTCDQAQLEELYGPVSTYLYEGNGDKELLRVPKGRAPLKPTPIAL